MNKNWLVRTLDILHSLSLSLSFSLSLSLSFSIFSFDVSKFFSLKNIIISENLYAKFDINPSYAMFSIA